MPGTRAPFAESYPWYVLLEISSGDMSGRTADQMMTLLETASQQGLIRDAAIAGSLQQAHDFWHLRETFSEAQKGAGGSIKHDISVPISRIPAFVAHTDALLARGVGAVVMTLGDKGALYRDRTQSFHVPVISAGPVVETTGAGDAFNGGFAVALAEGRGMLDAVRMGCATAGISVTRPGTAPSMPARAEIDALLKRSFG